ncbi:hypothetical protein JCGZ_15160 [Jatropha curcas]|uniref:J domain-containing protein n=1 Tax=Jatropha curcas TaxID=180498 RepID=A0A067LKS2_JATCU|nr:chaperone protein dnaJ 20, chloroplastic [Jatropha curcas]KDP45295.1 hypothetical protein JCGZ_15160 [Jatropha curcas]
MSTAEMLSPTFQTISKPNLSSPKSILNPSSKLSFSKHLPKSNFSFKNTTSKTNRAGPIKAVMAYTLYVKTESFYDLLGISENGNLSEIKKAYKQLARKYHPDVSPPECKEEYTKKFIEVQEAYETLSDPKSRALYDRDMASGGLDLNSIFSTGKGHRSRTGFDDRCEWEQKWQSQLTELIRRSNTKEFEDSTWGDKMRSQKSYCH